MLTQACKKHDIYLATGSAIEVDPKYPGVSFNTTPIIGPEGVLIKYRKVNTAIPREPSLSPADLLLECSEELSLPFTIIASRHLSWRALWLLLHYEGEVNGMVFTSFGLGFYPRARLSHAPYLA